MVLIRQSLSISTQVWKKMVFKTAFNYVVRLFSQWRTKTNWAEKEVNHQRFLCILVVVMELTKYFQTLDELEKKNQPSFIFWKVLQEIWLHWL